MYKVYILYSSDIERYYVGYTSMALSERVRRHNTNHKGFTGRANDWVIVWSQDKLEKLGALALEKRIKGRGSKRFLLNQD